MKKYLPGLSLLATALLLFSCETKNDKPPYTLNYNEAKELALNQNNPALWDTELFRLDSSSVELMENSSKRLPIQSGAFPVAHYNSFGIGNYPDNLTISNRKIMTESSIIYTDSVAGSKVSFTILVLGDKNAESLETMVTSRNHPYYLAQGSFKTYNNRIDWLALQPTDNTAYAVVNMRLFDLRFGRMVLVAPQKDKTLRFLQLEVPDDLTEDSLPGYLDSLTKSDTVIEFFTTPGSIE